MSWSDLSTKLKQNVVGRLDLMSRHAMRSTCRLNRYLVNDMDFFVPRVRVSVKEESRILIMIHTGIDQFLRIEMWIGPHRKTIIRKFQNTYDARESIEKVVPSIPRIHVARILCSLLSHKKLLIGTMEWEFDGEVVDTLKPESKAAVYNWIDKIHSFVDFLQKFSRKSHVFRANILVTTYNMIYETEELLRKMYDPLDLKKIERISVLLSKESLTPLYSFDSYTPLRVGRIRRYTENICHEYDEGSPGFLEKFVYLTALSAGFGVIRFAKFDDFARRIWNRVRKPVTVFTENLHMKVELGNSFKGHLTLFHMRSPCGYWIYTVLDSRRADFDAYNILNNSCGLGWLCKRCTDSFEYNYYQNLGRRVFWEPEWNDMVISGHDKSAPSMNMLEMTKKRYEEDERKKRRNSGDTQMMWGFGDVVARCGTQKKDSEDPDDSKDVGDVAVNEKKGSGDSKYVTPPESPHQTFQKLTICITSFVFLSCAFYAIFF